MSPMDEDQNKVHVDAYGNPMYAHQLWCKSEDRDQKQDMNDPDDCTMMVPIIGLE